MVSVQIGGNVRHFYPRSPCGERLRTARKGSDNKGISIHALLAESDKVLGLPGWLRVLISIHALLAESDEPTAGRNDKDNIFLSTLSLRRATAIDK